MAALSFPQACGLGFEIPQTRITRLSLSLTPFPQHTFLGLTELPN